MHATRAELPRGWKILAGGFCLVLPLFAINPVGSGWAEALKRHPPEDMQLHFDFYSHWKRKLDGGSCCDDHDCYPTVAHFDPEQGVWYARRREDGKWLRVPKYVFNQATDASRSPDGRPHLCALMPRASGRTFYFGSSDDVICFTPAEAS